MKIKINNIPTYAYEHAYIVARNIDDELWFWGAWMNKDIAERAARTLGGIVIAVEEVA